MKQVVLFRLLLYSTPVNANLFKKYKYAKLTVKNDYLMEIFHFL